MTARRFPDRAQTTFFRSVDEQRLESRLPTRAINRPVGNATYANIVDAGYQQRVDKILIIKQSSRAHYSEIKLKKYSWAQRHFVARLSHRLDMLL
jgi:hypothetical protein